MSQDLQVAERFRKRAVLELPGMNDVEVRRNIPFGNEDDESSALAMDIYYPSRSDHADLHPAGIYVMGYPDPAGMIRQIGMADSWARLAAASGFAMVLYGNREPETDLSRLMEHISAHASELSIDPSRLGLFAASGNAPTALWLAMQQQWPLRFVALNCGFTLDLEGSAVVEDAARQYGFRNACAGQSIHHLPADLPLLLTRAGRDEFSGLNEAMDHFIAVALKRNLPLTVINHATGPHGFDLFDDSDMSRHTIREMLDLMKYYLTIARE